MTPTAIRHRFWASISPTLFESLLRAREAHLRPITLSIASCKEAFGEGWLFHTPAFFKNNAFHESRRRADNNSSIVLVPRFHVQDVLGKDGNSSLVFIHNKFLHVYTCICVINMYLVGYKVYYSKGNHIYHKATRCRESIDLTLRFRPHCRSLISAISLWNRPMKYDLVFLVNIE